MLLCDEFIRLISSDKKKERELLRMQDKPLQFHKNILKKGKDKDHL